MTQVPGSTPQATLLQPSATRIAHYAEELDMIAAVQHKLLISNAYY